MTNKNNKQKTDCGSIATDGESPMVWFVRDLNNRADRVKHLECNHSLG